MNNASEIIPGYTYGAEAVAKSWISLQELEQLKTSVGFTAEDERYLRWAGQVLGDQTKQIVEHWRSGIIAGISHLARHSRFSEESTPQLFGGQLPAIPAMDSAHAASAARSRSSSEMGMWSIAKARSRPRATRFLRARFNRGTHSVVLRCASTFPSN
jgi:hypothetical protein